MSTIYTINGKVLKNVTTGKWLAKKEADPYNPLGLPAGVMRMKMPEGWTIGSYDTVSLEFTQVSSSPNVWDMKVNNGSGINDWNHPSSGIIEVMGFNPEGVTGYDSGIKSILTDTTTRIGGMRLTEITTFTNMLKSTIEEVGPLSLPNVTNMSALFSASTNLRYVEFADLENLEDCSQMFAGCSSLTSMPILNGIQNLTEVDQMFASCPNIASGILDMYNRLSNISSISKHKFCFSDCGSNTVTGAAERAQIPSSWGGTGA